MPPLRELRDRQALTQRDLAERAGVSKTTIVNIEKGQRPLASVRRKLAAALGVQPAEIDWPSGDAKGDGDGA